MVLIAELLVGCAGRGTREVSPLSARDAVPPAVQQFAATQAPFSQVVSTAHAQQHLRPAGLPNRADPRGFQPCGAEPTLLAAAGAVPVREPTLPASHHPPATQPAVLPAQFAASVVEAQPQPLPRALTHVDPAYRGTESLPLPTTGPAETGLRTVPIDFATALRLTQGQNPRIALAQAAVEQAYGQYEQARVLWLPSLRAGMNYNKHEGRIQDVVGENIETSRGATYGGLGASAVGAGSPAVPGVLFQFHVTDAIYQPQIRGFALEAREHEGAAAMNDQLLDTAIAYLRLLEALQRRAIAAETLHNGEQLATLTSEFARAGAGTLADADRAAAAVSLLRNDAVRTEEDVAVASARLAQHLSADPTLFLLPQEPAVVPIDLVSGGGYMAELVATGLSNRPELAASRALVCEAVNRLQREQNAPWLPSVVLGISYGAFAAGTGGDITNPGDRFDFDAIAWWEVRNLGFGERAARDTARAQIQQARIREVQTMDLVAREIVETHTQVDARRRQIAVAEQGIVSAQQSFARNLERIRNAQGLPIEVLQSIQALDGARRDYLRAVVDYNEAQFRLHRALGWPVSG
jgi:outer membrane protein TolC